MSTQVVTEKWAGQFDCVECRRKRLIATEFSKKVSLPLQLFDPVHCFVFIYSLQVT
jgi:hypothetical protein